MSTSIFSMLAVVIAFFLLVFWVYKPSNKQRFNEYANIPLNDDMPEAVADVAVNNTETAATNNGSETQGEQR